MIELGTVLEVLKRYKYAAMFAALFFSAMGLPLPEEVTLIATGLAVGWEQANFWPASIACVLGILASDAFLFAMGRYCGGWFLSLRPVRWLLTETRQARIERLFDRHGRKAVFIARFFAGARLGVYVYAGQHGMSWIRFLLLDLAGAVITGPGTILLGMYAASQAPEPEKAAELARVFLHEARYWLLALAGLFLFAVAGRWLWKRRQTGSGATQATSSRTSSPCLPSASPSPSSRGFPRVSSPPPPGSRGPAPAP